MGAVLQRGKVIIYWKEGRGVERAGADFRAMKKGKTAGGRRAGGVRGRRALPKARSQLMIFNREKKKELEVWGGIRGAPV